MNSTVIRRYLQPSPTLRWHPWAPVAAGALLLLFVFYAGAQWGKSAERREFLSTTSYAPRIWLDHLAENQWPGERIVGDALAIDSAVEMFVKRQARVPAWWEAPRARLEAAVLGTQTYFLPRETIVGMAKFRLKELSPASERWAQTSNWCARHSMPVQEVDVLAAYRKIAADYSTLLGRDVRPQDLAPAVPGWKCAASSLRNSP
jgi:hypothetical protein